MSDALSQLPSVSSAIKTYGRELFRFIRGRVAREEDAEDILQDVWVQLADLADPGDIVQMSAWLYKVARNKIIDRGRKKGEKSLTDLTYGDEDEDELNFSSLLMIDGDDPESAYLKETIWNELFSALDELPENQRSVFILNELEDVSLKEIAEQQGEKLKTIISRKGYAIKHLRGRLDLLYKELLEI